MFKKSRKRINIRIILQITQEEEQKVNQIN